MVIKSRSIGYLREMKNTGKIFVSKSLGKRPLMKFRLRWEDNTDTFTAKIRVFHLSDKF
jgi:hypothetical protein